MELNLIGLKNSSNQILFYDKNQSIKPTDIDSFRFKKEKNNSDILYLTSQHRSQGEKAMNYLLII